MEKINNIIIHEMNKKAKETTAELITSENIMPDIISFWSC